MTHTSRKNTSKPKVLEQNHLIWEQTGSLPDNGLPSWDPDTAVIVQALLEVLGTGCTVVIRPGSGGRALGVSIWEGDTRHPPKWLYDHDEWNDWGHSIVAIASSRRAAAAD